MGSESGLDLTICAGESVDESVSQIPEIRTLALRRFAADPAARHIYLPILTLAGSSAVHAFQREFTFSRSAVTALIRLHFPSLRLGDQELERLKKVFRKRNALVPGSPALSSLLSFPYFVRQETSMIDDLASQIKNLELDLEHYSGRDNTLMMDERTKVPQLHHRAFSYAMAKGDLARAEAAITRAAEAEGRCLAVQAPYFRKRFEELAVYTMTRHRPITVVWRAYAVILAAMQAIYPDDFPVGRRFQELVTTNTRHDFGDDLALLPYQQAAVEAGVNLTKRQQTRDEKIPLLSSDTATKALVGLLIDNDLRIADCSWNKRFNIINRVMGTVPTRDLKSWVRDIPKIGDTRAVGKLIESTW